VDHVLGIGIAGAFDEACVEIGTAHWVAWESFADLGAEDGEQWLDFPALALPGLPQSNRIGLGLPTGMTGVGGTTASAVTGCEATARMRRERTGADVESMEGAAWALVAGRFGIALWQARGISNRVGRRDRSAWRIGEALKGLGALLGSTPDI
jgi:futalosine hydrolase